MFVVAITAYGYDREAGGMTGDRTEAGVPIDLWNTWSNFDQDLYRQDYMRTEAQQNYSTDVDPATGLAYVYTGIIDHYTGLEAVEIGETYNIGKEYIVETVPKALNIAGEGALLLGLAGIALLLRK